MCLLWIPEVLLEKFPVTPRSVRHQQLDDDSPTFRPGYQRSFDQTPKTVQGGDGFWYVNQSLEIHRLTNYTSDDGSIVFYQGSGLFKP